MSALLSLVETIPLRPLMIGLVVCAALVLFWLAPHQPPGL